MSEEPPVAGRPDDFSGLVGFYEIRASATPTDLRLEDPLVLTVRITGAGPAAYQPQRRQLRIFPPAMNDDFYVEPLPDKDRLLSGQKTWEFAYRLRPKREDVKRIRSLKLVYYSPARQRFQSTYCEEIALTVRPRPVTQVPADAVKNVRPPARFYELATGPAVLRREERLSLPGLAFLFLILAPPGLGFIWYLRWRRLHPDDGLLGQQRRSRAAQLALQLIEEGEPTAGQIFAAVTAYLRSRLDLSPAEPTRLELTGCLARLGISRATRQKAAEFLESSDAARFAPTPAPGTIDLATAAAHLVKALESEPSITGFHPRPRRSAARTSAALLVLLLFGRIGAQEQAANEPVSEPELLAQAEASFLTGEKDGDKPLEAAQAFARAADLYDGLRRRGINSPDLCRNLGNAALLAGQVGRAVFAFRLGLSLAPNDGGLQANLEYVRGRVQYPSGTRSPEPSWPTALPEPGILFWQCLCLAFWGAATVCWVRRFTVRRRTWPAIVLTLAALLAAGGIAFAEWQNLQERHYPLAVIARDGTPLYRGNGESYPRHPTLAVVNEGMEARCLVERGDWVQIRFASGQIGWLHKNAILTAPGAEE
jgi:hypothetical protein